MGIASCAIPALHPGWRRSAAELMCCRRRTGAYKMVRVIRQTKSVVTPYTRCAVKTAACIDGFVIRHDESPSAWTGNLVRAPQNIVRKETPRPAGEQRRYFGECPIESP